MEITVLLCLSLLCRESREILAATQMVSWLPGKISLIVNIKHDTREWKSSLFQLSFNIFLLKNFQIFINSKKKIILFFFVGFFDFLLLFLWLLRIAWLTERTDRVTALECGAWNSLIHSFVRWAHKQYRMRLRMLSRLL